MMSGWQVIDQICLLQVCSYNKVRPSEVVKSLSVFISPSLTYWLTHMLAWTGAVSRRTRHSDSPQLLFEVRRSPELFSE